MIFPKNAFFIMADSIDLDALGNAADQWPFTAPGSLDWQSTGYVPHYQHSKIMLRTGDVAALAIRTDRKVLTPSMVNTVLAEIIADIEANEVRKVGRRERLGIKEKVIDELLPRALSRSSTTRVMLSNGLVITTDAGSSAAENTLSILRETLPPFPARKIRTAKAIRQVLTSWVLNGAPEQLTIGDIAALQAADEVGRMAAFKQFDLGGDDVRHHLAAGMEVVRLELVFRERIAFVIDGDFRLRRLQWLDVIEEEARNSSDDIEALALATLSIAFNELHAAFTYLLEQFGGEYQTEGTSK